MQTTWCANASAGCAATGLAPRWPWQCPGWLEKAARWGLLASLWRPSSCWSDQARFDWIQRLLPLQWCGRMCTKYMTKASIDFQDQHQMHYIGHLRSNRARRCSMLQDRQDIADFLLRLHRCRSLQILGCVFSPFPAVLQPGAALMQHCHSDLECCCCSHSRQDSKAALQDVAFQEYDTAAAAAQQVSCQARRRPSHLHIGGQRCQHCQGSTRPAQGAGCWSAQAARSSRAAASCW